MGSGHACFVQSGMCIARVWLCMVEATPDILLEVLNNNYLVNSPLVDGPLIG